MSGPKKTTHELMAADARAYLEGRKESADVAELAELVELFKKWWRDGHAFASRDLGEIFAGSPADPE